MKMAFKFFTGQIIVLLLLADFVGYGSADNDDGMCSVHGEQDRTITFGTNNSFVTAIEQLYSDENCQEMNSMVPNKYCPGKIVMTSATTDRDDWDTKVEEKPRPNAIDRYNLYLYFSSAAIIAAFIWRRIRPIIRAHRNPELFEEEMLTDSDDDDYED